MQYVAGYVHIYDMSTNIYLFMYVILRHQFLRRKVSCSCNFTITPTLTETQCKSYCLAISITLNSQFCRSNYLSALSDFPIRVRGQDLVKVGPASQRRHNIIHLTVCHQLRQLLQRLVNKSCLSFRCGYCT